MPGRDGNGKDEGKIQGQDRQVSESQAEPAEPIGPADQDELNSEGDVEVVSLENVGSLERPEPRSQPDQTPEQSQVQADASIQESEDDTLSQVEQSSKGNVSTTPLEEEDNREADEWIRLVQVFEREAESAKTERRKAELYYEIGRLWEQRLGALKQAMDAYEKAIDSDRTYLPAVTAARRLLVDSNQWEKAVDLLRAEIELLDSSDAKSLAFMELSDILAEHLDRPDEAREALEQAAALDPGNLTSQYRKKQWAKASGDVEKQVEAALAVADTASEPSLKAYHLFEAANLMERHDPAKRDAALDLYRQSLLVDPSNANTVRALRRLLLDTGRYEDLLTLFNTEIRLAEDNQEKALLLYQSARICTENLNDQEKAVTLLKQAADMAPDNLLVLNELEKVCENNQMWQDLADVYERLANAISDSHNKVSLYYKLGLLWEEKLFDDPKSIEAFSKITEVNPSYLPALQALGKLYAKNKEWTKQIEMLLAEANATDDRIQQANRYFKAAEILEERLGDEEQAISMYRKVLELIPKHLPALKALGSLYNKHQRWEDLVELYLGELEATSDKAQKVHVLEKLGSIYEEKLGQREKAIEVYQRLLQEVPEYLPAVRLLGRIFFQEGRWEDLLKVNEQEANIVQDPSQIVALYHKNGEIYEEKLEDKDRAIEYYRKALSIQPTYVPSLSNLGRIYLQRGNWEDLVNMYYQEIEVTQSKEVVVNLQYKIGEIWEEKLLDEDNAIDAYMRVLDLEPNYIPALEALARIYSGRRDWSSLVETYERQLDITEDEKQRIFLLFKIGEIQEEKLKDAERAIQAYRKALDMNPDYLPAIRSLVRLYAKTEQWAELLSAYEAELATTASLSRKVTLLQVMADIHENKLSDPDSALYCYEQIVEMVPDHMVALRVLEGSYRTRERWDDLYSVLSRLAELVTEQEAKIAMYLEMARLAETRLKGKASPGDIYLKILEVDPLNRPALDALEGLYRKAGMWDGLAETLNRKRKLATNPTEVCVLSHQLGDLYDKHLDDPEQAVRLYKEALENDSKYLPSIKAMKRSLTRMGRWSELVEVLQKEADAAQSPYQEVATYFQMGFISRTKLQDTSAAKRAFEKALELDPLHGESFRNLESILLDEGDYQGLLDLYEKRAQAETSPAELASIYDRAARLSIEKIGDREKAQYYLAKALENDPQSREATATLSELKVSSEQWEEATSLLEKLVGLGGTKDELVTAHYKAGMIYHEHLSNPPKAEEHFKAVLSLDPDNAAALEKLGDIYLDMQDWRNALETINHLIPRETSRQRLVTHYLKLATAYLNGFNDAGNAEVCYQRALEVEPASNEAVNHLIALYKDQGRLSEAALAYERFIDSLPPDARAKALQVYHSLGELYVKELHDMEKAIQHYRKAVNHHPAEVGFKLSLAGLMASTPAGRQEAIELYRQVIVTMPGEMEAYHELGRLFREMGETDKAYVVLSLTRFLKDATDEEKDFLSDVRSRVPKEPKAKLSEEDHEGVLVHPDERGILRKVAKLVGEGLPKAFQDNPIKALGLGRSDRLSAKSGPNLRRLVDDFAGQLGLAGYDAFLSARTGEPATAFVASPPTLVLSPELDRQTKQSQKFHIARTLELLVNQGALFTKLGPAETRKVFAATIRAVDKDFEPTGLDKSELDEMGKKIYKGMSRKARKAFEPLVGPLARRFGEADFESYVKALVFTADRAGLVLSGDLGAAVSCLMSSSPMDSDGQVRVSDTREFMAPGEGATRISELLSFALSDQHFLLRKKLGMAVE